MLLVRYELHGMMSDAATTGPAKLPVRTAVVTRSALTVSRASVSFPRPSFFIPSPRSDIVRSPWGSGSTIPFATRNTVLFRRRNPRPPASIRAKHPRVISLLSPALLRTARARVASLSTLLLRLPPSRLPDATVARGSAGVALAHAYLARLYPDRPHARAAIRHLSHAFAHAPGLPASLLDGFVGPAWVAEHLRGDASADPNEDVDGALQDLLGKKWRGTFGVADGLSGLGIYALERGEEGGDLLEAVVHRLALGAARALPGIAWRDGNGAACAVLGAASASRIARDIAHPLFKASAEWLVAQPDLAPMDALALVRAARAAGPKALERRAIAAALRTLDAPIASDTPDAPDAPEAPEALDRGGMWTAHAAHALYRLTDEPRFRAAARAAVKHLLAVPDPRSPGLLDGRAGLALVLATATSKDPAASEWDRVLVPTAASLASR